MVTKTSMDVSSHQGFVDAQTEAMATEVDAVLVTGFWLSACVAATAASCAERLAGRVPVVVPLSLAATRLQLYDPTDDHPAGVDVTRRLGQLRGSGVVVCDTPDTWRSDGAVHRIPPQRRDLVTRPPVLSGELVAVERLSPATMGG